MQWITDGERWRAWLVDYSAVTPTQLAWASPHSLRPAAGTLRRSADEHIALAKHAGGIVAVRHSIDH